MSPRRGAAETEQGALRLARPQIESMITRRKVVPVFRSDLGYGTHGRRMNVRDRSARWAVFADGEQIGEYFDRSFRPTIWDRAIENPQVQFVFRGTWAQVRGKLARELTN